MIEDPQETMDTGKETFKEVEKDIEETVSEYRSRIKKELLDRYGSLISVKKEVGKYFFMGQWLERYEISKIYQFMKRKDRSLILYIFCLVLILVLTDISLVVSLLPDEKKAGFFLFFSNLFK